MVDWALASGVKRILPAQKISVFTTAPTMAQYAVAK